MTRRLILCLLVVDLLLFQPIGAQEKSPPSVPLQIKVKPEVAIAHLQQRTPQLMQAGEVPGLSIALIREAKLIWQHGFGVKNAETKEPVTDSTVFEAASLSKPVFAYAVLKLVDGGKLDLDKPLNQYLPGNYDVGEDTRLNQITARRVLTHTTGFPNWRPNGSPVLKIFFAPGEKFSYSGEGFVYLAKVVEHLAGEPFDVLKYGVRKERYKEVRCEPVIKQDLKDYSGTYVSLDLGYSISLQVASNGKIEATGHEPAALDSTPGRQFTLKDAKIEGALLTAAKVYSDGTVEKFEGVFINRTEFNSPTDSGVSTFGVGVLGKPIEVVNGLKQDKFFFEMKR